MGGWVCKPDQIVTGVNQAATGFNLLDVASLQQQRDAIRYALLRDGLEQSLVLRCFALTREYAARILHMRHYDEQLFGAWVIVNGSMAEMATGEGKSFTATLAAATAAMAGIPVHVITTNEYLAARDADKMRPLFAALGLSVATVLESMDLASKRAAYRCDITYCTNKQVAFDYLRDRLALRKESGPLALKFSSANQEQQLVLRGLCFAIVDEADSVLIDDARTPLILSRQHQDDQQRQIYQQALDFAYSMQLSEHFLLHERERKIELTVSGRQWLALETQDLGGVWTGQRHGQYLVHQALCAIHMFQRDTHYLVRDNKIEIIDQNTGRTMADRSWQRGLQQLIECKEGCDLTGQRDTLASISYQQFFGRYLRLGGMSGTLRQVAAEMRSVYRQRVITVATHRPGQRHNLGFTVHRRAQEKWLAVVARVENIHASGRPVLVGTVSVRDSELLSSVLARRGLAHRILNAREEQEEAKIIAQAGQRGQITIATSMAGRGTDIKLGSGVAELGGLHILSTECHEEYRVDRQLYGRCARQGNPGSTETHVSLNDSLFHKIYPAKIVRLMGAYLGGGYSLPNWLIRCMVGLPQYLIARQRRIERGDVMQLNEKFSKLLAYSGKQE